MKKTTKIISLLLTLVMMLTMVLPVSAQTSFTDVGLDHNYYEAITNLSSEGILNGMGDGTFAPGGAVTRAQFTKIICYALSMGDITYSDEEKAIFTDVAPDHWAANNIVTGYKQGIINGMGDGTFAPEASVNYEQAVKMVVCALGYTEKEANAKGGYPGGYMSIASSAKILKGINDAVMGQPMNRGSVAQLVDSMLDARQIVDGEETTSIREERNDAKKVEGKVVAAEGVTLEVGYTNPCKKNEIALRTATNEIVFDIEELDIDVYDILGRNVIVYYEDKIGTNDVATNIALQAKKNKETTIDFKDINTWNSTSIEYFTDDTYTTTETISYASDADVLYNGKPIQSSIGDLLEANLAKPGSITLVSSQSNTAADVVFVKAYETVIVKKTDKASEKVFGKNAYTEGTGLDLSDNSKSVIITKDGKAVSFESLRENTIISVAMDNNVAPTRVEVLISSKTTKAGLIKEMPAPDKLILSTDSKIYNIINPWTSTSANGILETGKTVTLYFDHFGNVVRYEIAAAAALNYGYLSQLEEDDGFIQIAVYEASASNSTPNYKIYDLAERVKINGRTYNVSEDTDEVLSELKSSADKLSSNNLYKYAQPIRFSVKNSNNKVIENIVTTEKEGSVVDSLNVKDKTTNNGIKCEASGQRFVGGYSITSSTPIILVPHEELTFTHDDQGNGVTVTSVDKFQTKSSSYFRSETTYYLKLANANTLGVAACVYVYASTSGTADKFDSSVAPFIIKNIGSKINPKDNITSEYYKLENIVTGQTLECYKGSNNVGGFVVSELEVGDVIRVALDDNDYIEAIEYAADRSAVAAGSFAYTVNGNTTYTMTQGEGYGTNADYCTRIGVVKVKSGDSFVLVAGYRSSNEDMETENFTVKDETPIYEVDLTKTTKVYTVTSGNIVSSGGATESDPMTRMMIYTKDGNIQAIVIFKY